VRRRYFLSLAGTIALPARAQTVPRIGFLQAGDPEPSWSLFKKAMAGIGYVDGRTIKIEYRNADAASGRLDDYATELVRLKVDVIVAALSPAIAAAKKATTTIPIVFLGGTPEIGVTGSVARPEGNTTGVYSPSTTVAGKGLQLFHEIRPQTKLFGLMLNAADPFHVPLRRDVEAAALAEKIELVQALIKSRDELVRAFETMVTRSVDGVLVQPTLGLDMAAELAFKYRLPAISFRREFADKGGLMSYGADQADLHRIVAGQVDKILKGTASKDIPVEQASRFELVVNQRTAKALGFVFPPMFLARVDEVIE
jgi:putative ABC transport system substrate-binding protein